jgi:hypothetical protein
MIPHTTAPPQPADGLAFRVPCPQRLSLVPIPFDPLASTLLDRVDALETWASEEVKVELAVLHTRLLWLEAVLRDLQGCRQEVEP